MTNHPVRLVLTDDLQRSRLTVFFRLLLAIPHFLWLGLIGTAVALGTFVNWFILLVRGRTPGGLHEFVAGYIRYAVHVEGYVFLAANPYPGFYPFAERAYPVDLLIDPPARQSRWVTGFRLFLFIPAGLLLFAIVGNVGGAGRSGYFLGGGLAGTASFLIWWAALFRGRAPRGLRDLVAWGLGYSAQASAYILLITDRYPYSGPEAHLPPLEEDDVAEPHPVTLTVTDDLRRSRLTVFFRLLLAIPHVVWLLVWSVLAWLAALANWLVTLLTGRSPRPLVRFLSAYVRYAAHVRGFITLVGNPFPGFVGQTGSYPIGIGVVPAGRQNRWVTGFRLPLAIPALLVSGAADGLLAVVALLGWFSALGRGRMPAGLRNAGAYAIGYGAQVAAYAFVLTDRYPDSTPRRLLRE